MSYLMLVLGVTASITAAVVSILFGTQDAGIAAISLMFAFALVPGILENHRKRIGWSKQSTTMTAFGLLMMGTIMLSLGLVLAFITALVAGTLWIILSAQAFLYEKPSNTPGA
jgi:hypothetical protein